MNPGDYRSEYAAYCSALENERYQYHSGLAQSINFEVIRDRYTDLWSVDAVKSIYSVRDKTPEHLETERTGLRALANALRIEYINAHTRELTNELVRCDSSANVEWRGERIGTKDTPDRLAAESDYARRRELAALWFGAVWQCDDLRAARYDELCEAVRYLGFSSRRRLYEDVTSIDCEILGASADSFLERTSLSYAARLAEWAAQSSSTGPSVELSYADSFFFERMALLDPYFPAHSLVKFYDAVMQGLGVRIEDLKNLRIDGGKRAAKYAQPACFSIRPPDDVRLIAGASNGIKWYASFFREASYAQHFAWTSRELAGRYPEFVYAPDSAARMGPAYLFVHLFFDPAWLTEYCGVRPDEARYIARLFALRETHDVRRRCANLSYAIALDRLADVRSGHLAETYVTLHTEATGFRYSAASRLLEAHGDFQAATELRARLFAVGLNEYLRTRYGRRWWATRGAGDELIDMWNTASRYSAEELARLLGTGELSFELLADELIAAMNCE